MVNEDDNVYKARLRAKKELKKNSQRMLIRGQGPVGQFLIFILKAVFENFFKGLYNFFVDILSDAIKFTQEMFFGDFKGFFAGKLKSKKGIAFEFTFFRYFTTLMVPPIGIFLARGFSAWYNIILCGLLCFLSHFIGIVYALIVMQNAPYSARYKIMKREKLARRRPPPKNDFEASFIPLLIFVIIMLTLSSILFGMVGTKQNVIGNPLTYIKDRFILPLLEPTGYSPNPQNTSGVMKDKLRGFLYSQLK